MAYSKEVNSKPQIIEGDSFTDARGTIRFVNDFDFKGVQRFYTITHPDTQTVRAWQGHKKETKYFYVTKGSFQLYWVMVDDWTNPSTTLPVHSEILTANQSRVMVLPGGHVNGFHALEPDSTMVVFSDMTLEESKADDFRFPQSTWKM